MTALGVRAEGGKFIYVFQNARGMRVGLARFFGLKQGLDDAIVPGALPLGVSMPEAHGRTLGAFPGDHRRQIDAVEQWLMRDLGTGQGDKRGVQIGSERWRVDGLRLVLGRPFHHRGHSQATLEDAALLRPPPGGFRHKPAVVAAVKQQRVLRDAQLAQALPQFPNLLIQQRDLAKVAGLLGVLIVVKRGGIRQSLRQFRLRIVRRWKPGHGEDRFVALNVFTEKLNSGIHGDHRAGAFELPVFAVATQVRIIVEKVQA